MPSSTSAVRRPVAADNTSRTSGGGRTSFGPLDRKHSENKVFSAFQKACHCEPFFRKMSFSEHFWENTDYHTRNFGRWRAMTVLFCTSLLSGDSHFFLYHRPSSTSNISSILKNSYPLWHPNRNGRRPPIQGSVLFPRRKKCVTTKKRIAKTAMPWYTGVVWAQIVERYTVEG